MNNDAKPLRNYYVMLREEFDDWAVLFDPDTGHGFGLNPMGVYLWKLLDGNHSIDALVEGPYGVMLGMYLKRLLDTWSRSLRGLRNTTWRDTKQKRLTMTREVHPSTPPASFGPIVESRNARRLEGRYNLLC